MFSLKRILSFYRKAKSISLTRIAYSVYVKPTGVDSYSVIAKSPTVNNNVIKIRLRLNTLPGACKFEFSDVR